MKKIISVLSALALLIPFISMIVLQDYYGLNRPESAQVEMGRIVPIQISEGHIQKTVYITAAEANWLRVTYALTAIGAGIFVCYVIVGVVKKKRETGDF